MWVRYPIIKHWLSYDVRWMQPYRIRASIAQVPEVDIEANPKLRPEARAAHTSHAVYPGVSFEIS